MSKKKRRSEKRAAEKAKTAGKEPNKAEDQSAAEALEPVKAETQSAPKAEPEKAVEPEKSKKDKPARTVKNVREEPEVGNTKIFLLLSFLVPFLVLGVVFARAKIYPFGDRQVLYSDCKQQYLPFLKEFQRKLKSGESLFYSWHSGMGTNFLSMIGYYISSPLNFLSIFLPVKYIREALAVFIMIRVGCASLFTAMFLKHVYRRNDLSRMCDFFRGGAEDLVGPRDLSRIHQKIARKTHCSGNALLRTEAILILQIQVRGIDRENTVFSRHHYEQGPWDIECDRRFGMDAPNAVKKIFPAEGQRNNPFGSLSNRIHIDDRASSFNQRRKLNTTLMQAILMFFFGDQAVKLFHLRSRTDLWRHQAEDIRALQKCKIFFERRRPQFIDAQDHLTSPQRPSVQIVPYQAPAFLFFFQRTGVLKVKDNGVCLRFECLLDKLFIIGGHI